MVQIIRSGKIRITLAIQFLPVLCAGDRPHPFKCRFPLESTGVQVFDLHLLAAKHPQKSGFADSGRCGLNQTHSLSVHWVAALPFWRNSDVLDADHLANVISLWCVSARHLPWNQLLTSAVIAIPSNFIMRHVMRPPNIDLHPQLRAFASWSPESNAVNHGSYVVHSSWRHPQTSQPLISRNINRSYLDLDLTINFVLRQQQLLDIVLNTTTLDLRLGTVFVHTEPVDPRTSFDPTYPFVGE
mmetsp:Transcript_14584/g.26348  ORF Transcript_14584/g.26348 Transcript_14584/m.26348 type:complete len:242 (-) Transcript_14584:2026-2751(-)